MAASTTAAIPYIAATAVTPSLLQAGRRRITPRAGHALEILGHAIEYLTDEFVHRGGALEARDGQLEAVQLLMALNRQIYFDCPVAPTLAERCQRWLGLRKLQF